MAQPSRVLGAAQCWGAWLEYSTWAQDCKIAAQYRTLTLYSTAARGIGLWHGTSRGLLFGHRETVRGMVSNGMPPGWKARVSISSSDADDRAMASPLVMRGPNCRQRCW